MNVAYVRVSTVEQNEARQVEALKRHNIDRWFIEKVSGKNMDRPELQKMLKSVQPGDQRGSGAEPVHHHRREPGEPRPHGEEGAAAPPDSHHLRR